MSICHFGIADYLRVSKIVIPANQCVRECLFECHQASTRDRYQEFSCHEGYPLSIDS